MLDKYNTKTTPDTVPFQPASGLSNPHLQTLFATFFRTLPRLKITTEIFELDDGDFVECFWYHKPKQRDHTPIVVLFHGLEGSYNSPYIRGMMEKLGKKGYACVVMHFRGCSGKSNRLARSYHSGDTADAKAWIVHLSNRYPNSMLFAVGYSLGGNMLLKLLGEWGVASPLKAAVSVCAPLQLASSANRLDSGFSKLYQFYLMRHLKKALLQKYEEHPMQKVIGINQKAVKKLKNFWEFDDAYTAPAHGFSCAKTYYQQSSAKPFLKSIKVDTLIIQALDDPFMTSEVLPTPDELSVQVTLELSAHGGHVGFVGGTLFRPNYWLEERIAHYFNTFV